MKIVGPKMSILEFYLNILDEGFMNVYIIHYIDIKAKHIKFKESRLLNKFEVIQAHPIASVQDNVVTIHQKLTILVGFTIGNNTLHLTTLTIMMFFTLKCGKEAIPFITNKVLITCIYLTHDCGEIWIPKPMGTQSHPRRRLITDVITT